MKIFINPGHGGTDCGAVGNGLKERDVALGFGQAVTKYLQAVGHTVKCFQYDGLARICAEANNFGADLFCSIHCNAANFTATGTETYHAPYSAKGWLLADAIQKQLVKTLPLADRGVKSANFYVLLYTDMPAVLVETAFIDNAYDAQLLRSRADDFARAIARGITDYR